MGASASTSRRENNRAPCLERGDTKLALDRSEVSEVGLKRMSLATSTIRNRAKLRLGECLRDHYKVVEVLGGGAFSKVYGCYHRVTGIKYACKAITVAADAETNNIEGASPLDSAMMEIELVSSLEHPNIVRLKECFVEGADVFLIMEILSGGTLLDELTELEKYREHEAKLVFRQIMEALKYMHSRNAVHCDIKLENIMLDSPGNLEHIKLIDLGLAIQHNATGGHFEEDEQYVKGTPLYMAPEVISGSSEAYRPPSDIWSCGILLHLMLTGEPPIVADSPEEVYKTIIETGSLTPDHEDMSEEAKDLLARLLVSNPKDRLTASEVLEHPWLAEDVKDLRSPSEKHDLSRATKGLGDLKILQDNIELERRMTKANDAAWQLLC